MCTVREIREAIQEDCRSQRDMESTEIDRVFQTLPFSQERDLFDKPPMPKRPYRRKKKDTDRPYFETTLIDRRIRIITSSFEAWYQKQTHYVKISERSNENGIYREA